MKTTRDFVSPFVDRSIFDAGDYSAERGWAQVDSRDKGVATWANPEELSIFTFCEGDTCLQEFDSSEEFSNYLLDLILSSNHHGWGPVKIDPRAESTKRAFMALGLGDYLH